MFLGLGKRPLVLFGKDNTYLEKLDAITGKLIRATVLQ